MHEIMNNVYPDKPNLVPAADVELYGILLSEL